MSKKRGRVPATKVPRHKREAFRLFAAKDVAARQELQRGKQTMERMREHGLLPDDKPPDSDVV